MSKGRAGVSGERPMGAAACGGRVSKGRAGVSGERPMGAAACGGRVSKGRAGVSGERPMGAASCRQQHTGRHAKSPPPLSSSCVMCRTAPAPSHGAVLSARGSGGTPCANTTALHWGPTGAVSCGGRSGIRTEALDQICTDPR